MAALDPLFENSERAAALSAAAARLSPGSVASPTVDDSVPLLEPLAGLLPGGLRRGDAVALGTPGNTPDALSVALLAGALHAGLWCAVVGVPEFGTLALTEMLGSAPADREALDRLLLIPEAGRGWAEVLAALADGVDVLLARPETPASAETCRRIEARLRQGRTAGTRHAAVLLVLGAWATARLTLRTARTVWTGLDGIGPTAGTGQITGAQAVVVAEGRATAGRARTARLWLPDAHGLARSLTDQPTENTPRRLTVVA